jgi:hypothetical protein
LAIEIFSKVSIIVLGENLWLPIFKFKSSRIGFSVKTHLLLQSNLLYIR